VSDSEPSVVPTFAERAAAVGLTVHDEPDLPPVSPELLAVVQRGGNMSRLVLVVVGVGLLSAAVLLPRHHDSSDVEMFLVVMVGFAVLLVWWYLHNGRRAARDVAAEPVARRAIAISFAAARRKSWSKFVCDEPGAVPLLVELAMAPPMGARGREPLEVVILGPAKVGKRCAIIYGGTTVVVARSPAIAAEWPEPKPQS
jgi:hypothetical protein